MVPVRWVRVTAWANLVGNLLIIATGGAVRLTASGLGCDNWPLCTSTSLVPGIDQGVHGIIEFGNRLMSPVLGILAVAALVAVWRFRRTRRDLWAHAWIILAGVVVQGVIGLGGVLTTQNGPHSGDDEVIRDSSAWGALVHVHAWLGYALAAALVVLLVGGLAVRARRYALAAGLLILTIAVQIAVGIAQANLGIPPLLVGIHMVLAGVMVALGVLLVDATRRPATGPRDPG